MSGQNAVRKHSAQCAKRRVFTFCALLLAFCGCGHVDAVEVVLLYTGNRQGFLEVCGCSDNQLGGVARRAALVRDLRILMRGTCST